MAASSTPAALHRMAESFLQLAREESNFGFDAKDMRRVRDAAEKAWLAVLQATDAATERHGIFPDPGARAHITRHEFLEGAGRKDLSDALHMFADKLHGSYFYFGAVPDRRGMDVVFDEVAGYIRRVTEEL